MGGFRDFCGPWRCPGGAEIGKKKEKKKMEEMDDSEKEGESEQSER